MLNNALSFFIHRKLLMNLIIIVLVLFGIFSLQSLKKESMPEIDMYRLIYTTIYPGASPEDVELQVTIPLEDAIKEVDDIKEIKSTSYENRSIIQITLEDYLTTNQAEDIKSDIQKAIDITDLPSEIKTRPQLTEIKTSKMPIIEVALAYKDYNKLRQIAKYLEKKIEKLPDVSKVIKSGYLDREVRIMLDPQKLIKTETPVDDIIKSLKGTSVRLSGGTLKSYENEKNIIIDEEFKNNKQIENSIIRGVFGNKTLKIKDVAYVEDGFEEPNTLIRFNGIKGISLSVIKKEKSDVIKTINEINNLLKKEKSNLPSNFTISLINDTSTYTKNRIKIVINNALLGFILVLISLKLFLDFRTAMWTAFGIPFSLLISFMVLKFMGLSINPLSLGGFIIVIGMLVDDGIVVAENIQRHIEKNDSILDAIRAGVNEVAFPVITTITTTIIAFLPLIFMSGLMGKFMKVMPVIVIVTLMASLLESLFILPSHLMHKPKKGKIYKKKAWVASLEKIYINTLRKTLRIRYWFLTIGFVIFIFSIIFAFKNMKFEILPASDVDSLIIRLEAPKDTSLLKMSDMVKKAESALLKIPKTDIDSFKTIIGQLSESSYGSNTAYISIYLTPYAKRTLSLKELNKKIRMGINAQKNGFTKLAIERERRGPPVGKPVDVTILAENDEIRQKAGLELKKFVQSLPGVTDVQDNTSNDVKEYRLIIDKEKLAQLGLNVFNVGSTIRTAYAGTKIFDLRQDNEDVDYKVIFTKNSRSNLNLLLNIPIRNFQGQLVRLNKFAKLSEVATIKQITRVDGQRGYTITSDLDFKQLSSVEARKKILKFARNILQTKYPNIEIIISGEAKQSMESIKSLAKAFFFAIVGIYFMLIILFNSIAQPIFVLSAVPFSIIGVIWIFYLHGQAFSFPSILGLIGLSGVVVNDSLIMVNYINNLSKGIKTKPKYVAMVLKGAVTRLRPIILTTVTTVLGLLPTVYGLGGTDFILVPVTMSMAYGLAFATIITLFFVPCLTVIYFDFKHFVKFRK